MGETARLNASTVGNFESISVRLEILRMSRKPTVIELSGKVTALDGWGKGGRNLKLVGPGTYVERYDPVYNYQRGRSDTTMP